MFLINIIIRGLTLNINATYKGIDHLYQWNHSHKNTIHSNNNSFKLGGVHSGNTHFCFLIRRSETARAMTRFRQLGKSLHLNTAMGVWMGEQKKDESAWQPWEALQWKYSYLFIYNRLFMPVHPLSSYLWYIIFFYKPIK